MDTPATGSKRKFIDPDSLEEVSGGKRAKVEQNSPLKIQVLYFIALCYTKVHDTLYQGKDQALEDVTAGIHVMNIVSSLYTILRQRAQGKTGITETKATSTRLTGYLETLKYEIPPTDLLVFMTRAAEACGIKFNKTSGNRGEKSSALNWYGMCGPYMNLLAGFGCRLKELRLGHQEVVFKKEGGKDSTVHISKFGLNRSHVVLLEGCRMPPERRSSMVQSLGPMTVLISYLKAAQGYTDKLKEACMRAFAHIPYIDSILSVIKGKPYREITGVLNLIADISIMITTRQASRAYPPPNVFMKGIFNLSVLRKHVMRIDNARAASDQAMEVDTQGLMDPGAADTLKGLYDVMITGMNKTTVDKLTCINFSGAGAFMLYVESQKGTWKFTSQMDQAATAQVVFHAWFGTYREDFGILKGITDTVSWVSRESIGDKFQKMNTVGTSKPFVLPRLKYYSKLSTASQTGLLAQNVQFLSALPVFSGARIRKFSEDLVTAAKKNIDKSQSIYTDVGSILIGLNKIRSQLAEQISEDGFKQTLGYTKWANTSALSWVNLKTEGWAPETVDYVGQEEGLFFA